MSIDEQTPLPGPAQGDPQEPGPDAASVAEAEPPKCATRTRLYRGGRVVDEGFEAERISDFLEVADDSFLWLDLHDPDMADLGIVTREFGLHPLAIEDAVEDHQRPKIERFPTHLFLDVYAVRRDGDRIVKSEVAAFITPRALITVRKSDFDVDALERRWDDDRRLAATSVGFLVYGLLDAVVDGQYQCVEQVGDDIDLLEDSLFASDDRTDIRRRGYELRRSLAELRRVVVPMHEILERMLRGTDENHGLTAEQQPYLRDVYDHAIAAADDLEASREAVGDVLATNFNEQGNDLNQITKKLAAWAAIIAVPTAVTGFYGQNLPYPGFSKEWGFVVSSSVIVAMAGGLWVLLRRRGWL